MKKLQLVLIFLGTILSVNGQNLIQNGSFENYVGSCNNPSPNGDFNDNVIDWYATGSDSTHGSSSVDLYCGQNDYSGCQPGPGLIGSNGSVYAGFHTKRGSPPYNEAIYQILSTPPIQGTSYSLSLDLITCQTGFFDGSDDFHIYANIDSIIPTCPTDTPSVQLLATIPNNAISSTQWQSHTISFVAPTNCNVLIFSGTCAGSQTYYYIDNIVLEESQTTAVIENDFADKLLIFPNPTDGNFSIDLGEKYPTVTITITDLIGKLILSNTYNESQLLNLKLEKPAGVYLLTIESGDKKVVIRLVKE